MFVTTCHSLTFPGNNQSGLKHFFFLFSELYFWVTSNQKKCKISVTPIFCLRQRMDSKFNKSLCILTFQESVLWVLLSSDFELEWQVLSNPLPTFSTVNRSCLFWSSWLNAWNWLIFVSLCVWWFCGPLEATHSLHGGLLLKHQAALNDGQVTSYGNIEKTRK